jgi:hypothetical protein
MHDRELTKPEQLLAGLERPMIAGAEGSSFIPQQFQMCSRMNLPAGADIDALPCEEPTEQS